MCDFPAAMALSEKSGRCGCVPAVAVDAITSFIMGFDPLRLVYLRVAAAAGLGCNDPRDLRMYTAEDGDLDCAGTLTGCGSIRRLR